MEYIILMLGVIILVGLSAIYSGLNIALMSLSSSELRRKAETGNKHAEKVLPVRTNSHLSLASILFANVAVISANSLLLERYILGLWAGLISTILIVVFGEVLPQAWFSRFALKFCAWCMPLLKLTIIITYPISKPLQIILDKMLGKEKEDLHSRHELGILISEHTGVKESELDKDEIEIIQSTLLLSKKKVKDIMTPLNKLYWLNNDTIIDDEKIDEIKLMGWSRIPILNKDLSGCRGVLLMKDMVDIDFDKKPLKVSELPIHKTIVVGSMTALDTMFRKFILARSHLIPIERDDKIIGIVTIEDLIEEILGHEIIDETDHLKSRV